MSKATEAGGHRTRRYERLTAWSACHALLLPLYKASGDWPVSERYGLTSQARRAGFSAAANIAEGASRSTANQFRHFLNVALGSLGELGYTLIVVRDVGILTPAAYGELEALRDHAGQLTWGL
jgi:four helix bundle protein